MPAEKADLEDLEVVIGLFIGGITRACPVRFLSLHDVIILGRCTRLPVSAMLFPHRLQQGFIIDEQTCTLKDIQSVIELQGDNKRAEFRGPVFTSGLLVFILRWKSSPILDLKLNSDINIIDTQTTLGKGFFLDNVTMISWRIFLISGVYYICPKKPITLS